MRTAILSLLVLMVISSPVLVSCQSSESVPEVEQIMGKAASDGNGAATMELDSGKLTVFVTDETSPSQAVPDVDVSVAEQQGVGLIYAADSKGAYLPELIFLSSPLSQKPVATIALSPASGRGWDVSQPMAIGINTSGLAEVERVKFSELGDLLKREYPEVKTLVFLSTEEVNDINESSVAIYKTPFPQVLYASFNEGEKAAAYDSRYVAYAAVLTFAFVVKAGVGVVLGDLMVSEKDVLVAVKSWITGRSPHLVYMPDLTGQTEEEAGSTLSGSDFEGFKIERHYEYLADEKYVTDHTARNLDGLIVSQKPTANTVFDPEEGENIKVTVVIWIGTTKILPGKPMVGLSSKAAKSALKSIGLKEPEKPAAVKKPLEPVEPPAEPVTVLTTEEIEKLLPQSLHGLERLSTEITSGCVLGIWHKQDGAKLQSIQVVICPFKTKEEVEKYRKPYESGETVLNAAKGMPGLVDSAKTSTDSIAGSQVFNLAGSSPQMGDSQITMTSGIYHHYGIFIWASGTSTASSEVWAGMAELLGR